MVLNSNKGEISPLEIILNFEYCHLVFYFISHTVEIRFRFIFSFGKILLHCKHYILKVKVAIINNGKNPNMQMSHPI